MGECLISRRGGEAYKLPILDASYPQDVTTIAAVSSSASFSIAISEHGKPTDYAYQWYVNGEAVSGATNANYVKSTTASDVGTYTVYCDITNKAGTISSRTATLVVKSAMPTGYSYNGDATLTEESDYDWNIQFKSSGTLVLPDDYNIDIFLQGGGGGGVTNNGNSAGMGGGAGGYQTTQYAQNISSGSYVITVGAGGSPSSSGGATSAFGYSASGGSTGSGQTGGTGGTGAGGKGGDYWDGGNTGYVGSAGSNGKQAFGAGSIYYGAGGGGGSGKFADGAASGGKTGGGAGNGGNATANTGSGGGGAADTYNKGGSGGSGIVIIRNAR